VSSAPAFSATVRIAYRIDLTTVSTTMIPVARIAAGGSWTRFTA